MHCQKSNPSVREPVIFRLHHHFLFIFMVLLTILFSGCESSPTELQILTLPVIADGRQISISTQVGNTVEDALSENGIELDELDRTIPPRDATINSIITITVTRVKEEFETVQEEIPFSTNILPNETMAIGDRRIIQTGINGLQEITYRYLYEDGIEVTRTISGYHDHS